MLWERLPSAAVKCNLCGWRCVIQSGRKGRCMVRENRGGVLHTLVYGRAASYAVDPIEKKPLYHFHPGSTAFSVATVGCNFRCVFCDNWSISQEADIAGDEMPPERLVSMAKSMGCRSISYTYTEPTIFFEYAYDTARLAHREGILNTFVTNGYMTPEALELLIEAGLDAMNVDIKGDAVAVKKHCGTDVEKVWRNCREARKSGVHIEVTTLVIPTVNDDEGVLRSIAGRIRQELGADTPWHCSGYYPAYKFTVPPTPLQTLERAYDIGKEEGLDFVYLGNVLGHRYENTYCPACGELLIQRWGLSVIQNRLQDNKCPQCGRTISVVMGT